MNCPRCTDVELLEKDRDGITVDGCPRCRGIWLDRGELERLVASVAKHHDDEDRDRHKSKHDHDRDHEKDKDRDRDRDRDRDSYKAKHDHERYPGDRKRKPRSWLESLTEMFD